MRKVNPKKKQRKEKERKEENSDAADDEYQDSKNGGSDENSADLQEKEKKSKKSNNERSNNDNGNVSDEEAEEEYEVEEVVDHKVENGSSLFLIKWKGYDSDGNTWEPEDTLSCPDLIAKFKKKAKRPKVKSEAASPKKRIKRNEDKDQSSSDDPNQEWEVEKVVDVSYEKDGTRLFRIRWKGYRSNSDTWEPEDNLNCEDLIDKFLKKRDANSKVPSKELREAPKQTKRFETDTFGRRSSKRNTGRLRAVYYDAE